MGAGTFSCSPQTVAAGINSQSDSGAHTEVDYSDPSSKLRVHRAMHASPTAWFYTACRHGALNPLFRGAQRLKTWRPPHRTPTKSPFTGFHFPEGQRSNSISCAAPAMLSGSSCKRLGDEGEIIRQRRNPTCADLIETKRPLWAAHIGWLKLVLGHLCLLKKQWQVSNKSTPSTADEVTGDEFGPQPSQRAMKTAALNRYN